MNPDELHIYSLLCMGLGGLAVIIAWMIYSLVVGWLRDRRRRAHRHLNRIVTRA